MRELIEKIQSKAQSVLSEEKINIKRASQRADDVDEDVLIAWQRAFPYIAISQRWTWKGGEGVGGMDSRNNFVAVIKHKNKIHTLDAANRLGGFKDAMRWAGLEMGVVR